jgi:hypothetical protein
MLCKSISGEKEPILKEPFIPRQLDVAALYTEGLAFHKDLGLQKTGAGGFSIVFPAEYGKTYEMHFSAETEALIAAVTDGDPRGLAIGHSMPCTEIRAVEGVPKKEDLAGLLYTPQKSSEYFVIYSARILNALGLDGAIRISPLHCHGKADIDKFLRITKKIANYVN